MLVRVIPHTRDNSKHEQEPFTIGDFRTEVPVEQKQTSKVVVSKDLPPPPHGNFKMVHLKITHVFLKEMRIFWKLHFVVPC